MPREASHSRVAFSSIASNTGVRSPGELLITPNTSAVAVCWSTASRVSVMTVRMTLSYPIAKPRVTAYGTKMKGLTIPGSENAKGSLAQPRCLLQHCVEHRREVAGRGVDDPQHLGGRGLLLERFARLGDEARVFHRDHRLRREVLQQRDLLVGEWPDLLAIHGDRSEQRIVLPQRHAQHGS